MLPQLDKIASTLTEEQCEAFWSMVSSSAQIRELYAADAYGAIYDAVTPDDVRALIRAILDKFADDDQRCVARVHMAIMSRAHMVQALIEYRVGNYAEFEFVKRHLPMSTLQKLVCQAIYEHSLGNN